MPTFNAYCGRSGIRRRTVLGLGAPLWAALSPQARLALLGHELGHLVNGDPRTAFLTRPALTTFARLANIFDPRGLRLITGRGSFYDALTAPFAYLFFWPIHAYSRWAHHVLMRVVARDHQRAEAYADALAVRLGGSAGADELFRVLLFEVDVRESLRKTARAGSADPEVWRTSVADVLADRAASSLTAEQLSLRNDVSERASRPPTGLRLRLARSWPTQAAAVVVAPARFAAVDRELGRRYERLRKSLAVGLRG